MSDITVKLRAGFGGLVPILCDEAANEIDKLRARIAHLEALILEYKEVAKAAIEYREETQVNICEGDFLDRALESVGMFGEADNG